MYGDKVGANQAIAPNDHINVNIRQIENGYIVRSEGCKDGLYFQREQFSHEWEIGSIVTTEFYTHNLKTAAAVPPTAPLSSSDYDDVPF